MTLASLAGNKATELTTTMPTARFYSMSSSFSGVPTAGTPASSGRKREVSFYRLLSGATDFTFGAEKSSEAVPHDGDSDAGKPGRVPTAAAPASAKQETKTWA